MTERLAEALQPLHHRKVERNDRAMWFRDEIRCLGARASENQGELTMRLSDDNIRGRTVITADGQAIGAVTALFVDASDWRVESLSVELHKDIADRVGAARSMFHRGSIEVPVALIQSIGDTVVLGVGVDDLREGRRTTTQDATPEVSAPQTEH
jgi:sporulation protein YlmC with PRC-barrel domain